MKFQLTLLLSFLILISCKQNSTPLPDQILDTDDYSLSYSGDWNITDNEEGFLAIEKEGFDSSGIVTIITFEGLSELEDLIQLYQEDYKENSYLNNLKFDESVSNNYNTIKVRSSSFKFDTMGIDHRGTIYVFNNEENSFIIMHQEALEDINKNSEGFKTIENSFQLNQ